MTGQHVTPDKLRRALRTADLRPGVRTRAAAYFHITPHTLYQHLSRHGVCLTELIREERQRRLQIALRHGVARRSLSRWLGYTNPANLSLLLRRLTGKSYVELMRSIAMDETPETCLHSWIDTGCHDTECGHRSNSVTTPGADTVPPGLCYFCERPIEYED